MAFLTRLFLFLISVSFLYSCSILGKNKNSEKEIVLVKTNYGNFKLKFYDDTPLHKQNFLHLVDTGFYDSVLFHRVIKNFMIQTGDPDSKNASADEMLGNGGPGYQIDSEIKSTHFHKKGVLAAAREGDGVNPERKSSGSQFYVVTGKVFSPENLKEMSTSFNHNRKISHLQELLRSEPYKEAMSYIQYCQNARLDYKFDSIIHTFDPLLDKWLDSIGHHSFTEEQINAYSTVGGAPHLDKAYTVFGEIIEGIEVIDRISTATCDQNDRPQKDILILGMKRVKN